MPQNGGNRVSEDLKYNTFFFFCILISSFDSIYTPDMLPRFKMSSSSPHHTIEQEMVKTCLSWRPNELRDTHFVWWTTKYQTQIMTGLTTRRPVNNLKILAYPFPGKKKGTVRKSTLMVSWAYKFTNKRFLVLLVLSTKWNSRTRIITTNRSYP